MVASLDSGSCGSFVVIIANRRRSFWGIDQSDCAKVIDNACSFFVSRSWSRSEKMTTVMTHIVADKSTDTAKPHSICFLPQYRRQRNVYFRARQIKKALRDKFDASSRQRQISQSDCEITGSCGKNQIISRL